jgi:hypothetical protein
MVEEVALRPSRNHRRYHRWSRRSLCDRHESTGAIAAALITTAPSIFE